MENNFSCLSCDTEFLTTNYSFHIKQGEIIYIIPRTNQLVCCPDCASSKITTIEKKSDLMTVMYGRFSSASEEEKKRILRKRADAHKKKTEEQYRTIDKEFRGRVNEKHY